MDPAAAQSSESPGEGTGAGQATRSPVGRPPRWLLWLFPGLGDLSENPLYIRLSGQGYGRRGLWARLAGPTEFRPTSLDALLLARPGLWPPILAFIVVSTVISVNIYIMSHRNSIISLRGIEVIFMLNAALIGWAYLLSVMRGATGRPRHAIIYFLRRGRLHGWGEDLILAGLTPTMIRAAIAAALIPRIIKRIFFLGACGAALILSIMIYDYFKWSPRSAARAAEARDIAALAIFYWFFTWGFFSGLEIFDFSRALVRADFSGEPEPESTGQKIKTFLRDGFALIKPLAPPSIYCAVALTMLFFAARRAEYEDREFIMTFAAVGLGVVIWSLYRIRAAAARLLIFTEPSPSNNPAPSNERAHPTDTRTNTHAN